MELVLIVAQFGSFFKCLYVHNKLDDITSLFFWRKLIILVSNMLSKDN